MAELTTAVGELLKGKRVKDNLGTYIDSLSSLYKRLATLRLSMNYFTFSEIFAELEEDNRTVILPYVEKLQRLIKDTVLDKKTDAKEAAEQIESLRNDIINIMEIMTAYTDNFQIAEYMLNRVEFRFKECPFNDDYYKDMFEKDIFRYVTSDKDNSVINMKIAQVVSQLPMRLSKNKFFDLLKGSLSIYKDSEKQSVDDFVYMIETAGAIYKPEGMNTCFPQLSKRLSKFFKADYDNMTEKEFDRLKATLDETTEQVAGYADAFVVLTEVINDVYSIILTHNFMYDVVEQDKLHEIIAKAYESIENDEVIDEAFADRFEEFEGLQEKIGRLLFPAESAMSEVKDINLDYIMESEFKESFATLEKISKLQSTSTFARLSVDTAQFESADEDYLASKLEMLITEFSKIFEKSSRNFKRAVMSSVLGNLPVFFNNLDEFKEYVHVALFQCGDDAERKACMSIFDFLKLSENYEAE